MSNYRIIERAYKIGKSTFFLQQKIVRLDNVGFPYETWENVKMPTGVLWFKQRVEFDSMEKMDNWISKNINSNPKEDKIIKEF